MTLGYVGQDDFAAGMLRGLAKDMQPGIGVFTSINGLFDDDGDVYRRGGTRYLTTNAADEPLTFMWEGFLGAKPCTLATTTAKTYSVVGTTLTQIGDTGVAWPCRPAIIDDMLFLPTGQVWAGATKPNYAAGTVTATKDSNVITGAGTAFLATVEPGMFIRVADGRPYRVGSINTNTELLLSETYEGATGAGQAYVTSAIATWAPMSNPLPTGTVPIVRHIAAIAGRLVIAEGNRISFSEAGLPFSFIPDDFHELDDGIIVQGLANIRDTLLVFTTYGLWSITNMALDLTDDFGNLQQAVSVVTPEIALWHEAGLAEWAGSVIAPCTDRIYMIGTGAPVPISDSIAPLYMEAVRSGRLPGGAAAFRNHYFLPIVSSNLKPDTVLVCRVNRPVKGRFTYYPYSLLTDHAGGMVAGFASNVTQPPRFLVAHHDGHVVLFTDIFDPGPANPADADATVHEFLLETRDFPTGNGQPNHVRRFRLYYTLRGGELQASYSTGRTNLDLATWGTMTWGEDDWASSKDEGLWTLLPGHAPSNQAGELFDWRFPRSVRARFIRGRLRSVSPATRLRIHRVEFGVRPATHQR